MNEDRIGRVPGVCGGAPIVDRRRITVENVVTTGHTAEDPEDELVDLGLLPGDLHAAREYCSQLKCLDDLTLLKFCANCLFSEVEEAQVDATEQFASFLESRDVEIFRGIVADTVMADLSLRKWVHAGESLDWRWEYEFDFEADEMGRFVSRERVARVRTK